MVRNGYIGFEFEGQSAQSKKCRSFNFQTTALTRFRFQIGLTRNDSGLPKTLATTTFGVRKVLIQSPFVDRHTKQRFETLDPTFAGDKSITTGMAVGRDTGGRKATRRVRLGRDAVYHPSLHVPQCHYKKRQCNECTSRAGGVREK